METNRLKQFYILAQTENLREAATIIGISHSGLSKSIKVLERELSNELIVQQGRGIKITEYGQDLSLKLPAFFESLKLITNETEQISLKSLKIATFEVFSTYFMTLLKEMMIDRELELHEALPGKMEDLVSKRVVDIAITYEPIPTRGLEFLKITTLEAGIYSANKKFQNHEVSTIPFAVPRTPLDSIPTGVKGLDGWPEDKFPRFKKYRVDMLETALQLASSGDCAVFIPKFLASLRNKQSKEKFKLQEIDLPKKMKKAKHDVYLIKRSGQEENIEFKKIARVIRSLCSLND